MEPNLQRLIELWSQSLESRLDASARRELDGLLADAPLLEQFSDWQAARSPLEAAEPGATHGLDARVMADFRRRVWNRRWLPWLAAGIAGLGLVAGLSGWGDHGPQADRVVQELAPDPVVEAAPTLAPPPLAEPRALGLPPGYGQRPTRLLERGQSVNLLFRPLKAGLLRARVLDGQGRSVRQLSQGPAQLHTQQVAWDGKDDRGRPLPAGRYRLVVFLDDALLAETRVELNPAP